jgi:hypothetical protein
MSRAQERSSGLQSGAQAAQQPAGSAPGTSDTSGTAANQTGATSTSLRDQPVTRTESTTTTYGRDTGTRPSYETTSHRRTSTSGSAGGVVAMVAGILTFLAGLAAIVRRGFFPTLHGYAYAWPVRNWGIVLVVLGALLFAAGVSHLLGLTWGRALGVGLAVLTTVAGFMWLAYSPLWGLLIVLLSVAAIFGLLRNDEPSRSGAM